MDNVTLKRLLFTKRLYLHGTLHSKNNTEIDRFMAIHHFDNSVELFLKIFATNEGILPTVKQDFNFKDLWNQVRTALEKRTPSYCLPLKDQMFNLHETRNLAQHQGDAPSHDTVIKYQEYTRDFFITCFKDIFDIEYDNVYASILVKDEKIRDALIEAEQKMESNDFKESMTSSTKAFAYIKLKETRGFSSPLSKFSAFGIIDRHDEIRFSEIHSVSREETQVTGKINSVMKSLVGNSNKLLNERAKKINDFAKAVDEELSILKLGMDYKSFKIFIKISPSFYFILGPSEPKIVDTSPENYTKENALFCHEFVLELALRLQNLENWSS